MDTIQKNLNSNELPTSPVNPPDNGCLHKGDAIWWYPSDEDLTVWPTTPQFSPTPPELEETYEPLRHATYSEWFSETFQKMLAKRRVDRYVYEFDKDKYDAWFTASFKRMVDARARHGYVYDLE